MCNCDMNDNTPRSDSGYIDEPQKLPLTAVQTSSIAGSESVDILIHPVKVSIFTAYYVYLLYTVYIYIVIINIIMIYVQGEHKAI